jgi:hypothetical protein
MPPDNGVPVAPEPAFPAELPFNDELVTEAFLIPVAPEPAFPAELPFDDELVTKAFLIPVAPEPAFPAEFPLDSDSAAKAASPRVASCESSVAFRNRFWFSLC